MIRCLNCGQTYYEDRSRCMCGSTKLISSSTPKNVLIDMLVQTTNGHDKYYKLFIDEMSATQLEFKDKIKELSIIDFIKLKYFNKI